MKKIRKNRPRNLQYETLERREVMTGGVTAGLSGGVLTVTGSDAADQIDLRQNGNNIYVNGLTTAWDASTVSSIVIQGAGGDDSISLNSLANGGSKALQKNVTVLGGAGNDVVHLANGEDVNVNGLNNSLFFPSAVAPTAGVTPLTATNFQTTFVNGVLTVSGTSSNDTINFLHAWNGYLAIQGSSGAWPASGVNSIVINLQGGDDQISLDSMANGGSFALGKLITINSGAGTKHIDLSGGRSFDMTGAGHQFKALADGSATYDGAPITFASAPQTVQTSYLNGVLTINCTNNGDTLRFLHAWNGYLAIQGVPGAWPQSTTTSIVINLNSGDDIISIDSLANGGSFALGVPLTINSGLGNKRVIFPGAHNVDFSGTGHQLKVFANGSATYDGWTLNIPNPDPTPDPDPDPDPDPPVTNWFDSHVVDSAMRSLGHTLYLDGLIDRSDMLSILRSAEDSGTVDSTELSDLQAIVANTSLFGSLDYVRKLSSYIVSGNTANAKFQGQTLGNLTAGAATAKLENLISKWFLGLDRPVANGTYRQMAGTLYVNGAAYTDIHQGSVGDCYFVSALAETALRNNAAITNMFIVNGDGTYTVRFFNGSQAEYVTVDSYLPTNANGRTIYATRNVLYTDSSNELWVALAEKAYVQLNEMGWERTGLSGSGQNSYAAIEGGYIYAALGHVSGQATSPFTWTASSNSFTTFVNAWNAGKSIGFASFSTPMSTAVVGNHAYSVVGYNAATQKVTLFNPWGTEYAMLTLSWTEIQQNFTYFDRTA